jgi:hypothetical protein
MKRRNFLLILLYAGGLGHAATADWHVPLLISVQGPTIVAFFPATDADLEGSNEALNDFQHYASVVEKPLEKRGIKFYQSYTTSFRLKLQTGTEVFTPKNGQCGYYFIVPGQKSHIEYGVTTDVDLLEAAKKYLDR